MIMIILINRERLNKIINLIPYVPRETLRHVKTLTTFKECKLKTFAEVPHISIGYKRLNGIINFLVICSTCNSYKLKL